MSFPTYPAYKDSGVKWLSDVPEHWDVRRNKQVFRLVSVQVGNKSADFQLLSLTLRGVIPRDMESGKGKFPAEFDTYQVVEPDDIVFCLFDIDETPRTVGISSDFGMITGAYTVAKTLPAADPRFIYYYYFSIDLRKGLRPFYTGLRKVVRPETFLNIELPLPPLSEQANICNFLDHETARIDALIEEQQRLIELLKEKRQAVISHAVTKGLDPTVPMKDSGVEWLGEVPAHWEVTKFKWPLRTASGGTPPSNDRETYYDGGIPWLRSLDLTDDLITEYEVTVTQRAVEETACKIVPKSSVLIAMYGGDGTIGKNGLLTFDSAINQAICAFLPSDRCAPEYLHRYIQFYRPYWMIGAESSRKDPNIGQDRIGDHFLVLPPPREQSEIVAFLGVELLKFSALIKEAQTGVEFLQERRSALISAAVTGKIDVRNWQPPASEQAPKFEVAEAD
ncbi:restriction endonuclease subunit S [Stutzerimonas sp.]|uniref:restriction endonuclease subunit S n=1 Tax=Stutzerimonas sp. TaxID=2901166 RepID=UPI0035B13BA3